MKDLIILLIMPLIIFGGFAFALRKKCFFKYLILNFLAAFMFVMLIELIGPTIVIINLKIGTSIIDPAKYHYENAFKEQILIAYFYTPIFCYYITNQKQSINWYSKIFAWINSCIISILLFGSFVKIIYIYFIFSFLFCIFLQMGNLWKNTMQIITIALGLFAFHRFFLKETVLFLCDESNNALCQFIMRGNTFFIVTSVMLFLYPILSAHFITKISTSIEKQLS